MLLTRPATLDDARYVGDRLRAEDEAEALLFCETGTQAVVESVRASLLAECIVIDGEPAAVVGISISDLVAGTGCPWLLTAAAVERHPIAFGRETKRLIKRGLALAPRLENVVDARYTRAIKWIRWLGFTVEPEQAGLRRFWMEV